MNAPPTAAWVTAAYVDRALRDPASARQQWECLQESFRKNNITFDGAPMATLLRPQFIDARAWSALREGSRRLVELCDSVSRSVFDGDGERLMEFLCVPERERDLLRVGVKSPAVALSRVDAFLNPRGEPRFIELNSDAPAGFGYADRMARAFAELPLLREAGEESRAPRHADSIPSLATAFRDLARGLQNPPSVPVIAIVDLKEVKTKPDQEILADELSGYGLKTLIADPREVEIAKGRMVLAGQPIDIVYRRTVIAEVLGLEKDARAFLDAYRNDLALFVNSFRCYLSEDKAFFAILTDERFEHLLSPDDRAFVARHVPWTRRVEERRTRRGGRDIDLMPFVEANRNDLVLKPAHAYGGRSVFIGSDVSDALWRPALDRALREKGWIVQERVAIPEEDFPVFAPDGSLGVQRLKVNTNPFYVAGQEAGAVTRVSPDSVINVSAGGGSIPCFTV